MVVNAPIFYSRPTTTMEQIEYRRQRAETNGCGIYSATSSQKKEDIDTNLFATYTGRTYDLSKPADYNDVIRGGDVYIVESYLPKAPKKSLRNRLFKRTDSMDGEIGYTRQGMTGDCWLITALNSISYSDKGSKMLKDMIKYGEDGAFVEFKGLNITVFVPYKKVFQTKQMLRYSHVDDDVKVIELAMEKVISEAINGNLGGKMGKEYQEWLKKSEDLRTTPLDGNSVGCAWMLLFGQTGFELTKEVSDIPQNVDLVSITLSSSDFKDKATYSFKTFLTNKVNFTDAKTGKKIELYLDHAYSVKSMGKDGVLEIVEPNTHDTYFLKAQDIKDIEFQYFTFN